MKKTINKNDADYDFYNKTGKSIYLIILKNPFKIGNLSESVISCATRPHAKILAKELKKYGPKIEKT
jgi:hypothetical protein